eukprot:TRINITY_DN6784_c0_g4_i1.p2 TRINITY_DN6784_c0_g4~~TRINITY_DN6784_c0_g4_i1.p2  ORF type:complete len:113 (-),score=15.44 TRINITY_DN6784_c0_g4_i1:166-504(-)
MKQKLRIIGKFMQFFGNQKNGTFEDLFRYLKPLKSGEKFEGSFKIVRISAARVVVEQDLRIIENQSQVLTAVATVVFLNKAYKPVRVTNEFLDAYFNFIQQKNQDIINMTCL